MNNKHIRRSGEQQTESRRPSICVYCHCEIKTTQDHVVPRCLFDKLPRNMVTVRACFECNQKKKEADEYLRDNLVTDIHGSNHPTAKILLEGKVSRSIMRNQSQFAKDVLPHVQMAPFYSPNGLYLGDVPMAPVNDQLVRKELEYIVRGLTSKLSDMLIPLDYAFGVNTIPPISMKETLERVKELNYNGPYELGDEFSCIFLRSEENHAKTVWILWFYGSVMYVVSSMPSEDLLQRQQPVVQMGPKSN